MSDIGGQVRALVPTPRQRSSAPDAPEALVAERPAPSGTGEPRRSRHGAVGRIVDLDPRTISGPKLPLVLLGLFALLGSWDEIALRVLLPEMRADFGLSLQFLLTLGSVAGVVAVVLAPAMGYLADRVRRVWMIRIGGLLSAVAPAVQGLAGGVPQLVLGRALGGAARTVQEPAGFPLLTDYYPSPSRARVFGFLGFMSGLGAIAGPVLAGRLGGWFGWRVAVLALSGVGALAACGLFLLREPVRGYQDRIELGAPEAVARRPQRPVSWSEGWRAAASVTTLRRLWYATPFLQAAWVGTSLFISLYYAQEFGLTVQQLGYVATIHGTAAVAGIAVAAPAADWLLAYRPGRVMVALGGLMLLYAASVVVLAVSHNLMLSVAVGLPIGFGFVAISPAVRTLTSLVLPARIRGLGMQTVAPWQLAGLLVLPFVGQAADAWGLRRGLLVFVPVYVIGALILMSSALGVRRDIRAATAAGLADEEAQRARARGRSKMLVCRDVDVHYDGLQAVFNVDFDVEEGEIVALVGTNGAGKSSLLRALSGEQQASNGAIFFDGHDITHVPPHEIAGRGIATVPGARGVFAHLSVADNLRAAAWLDRHDADGVRAATEEALDLFPVLRQRRQQPAAVLSGGEQRMLALALAFLARPRLLLLDELSLGLSDTVVDQLVQALRAFNARRTTIVVVEQSLEVARRIAGRLVFMEKGEIRFDGAADGLAARPDLVRSVLLGGTGAARGVPAGSGPRPGPGTGGAVLVVNDVSVSFGGVRALSGVSLEVGRQEVVGIIGPNGAGKSSLLDVISGFVPPDRGQVLLFGRSVERLGADARARLGLARSFQAGRLFPALTARENLAVAQERRAAKNPVLAAVWAGSVRGAERAVKERGDWLLHLFGLDDVADAFADELSTGTRRALDLACVTAAGAQVVLLDEPSSGLAQAETEELAVLLARVARDGGWAMLIVEHDLGLITSLADRVVAMDLGSVVTSGTPAEVLACPRVVGEAATQGVAGGVRR